MEGRKEGRVRAPSCGQSVQGHQDRLGARKYYEYLEVLIHSLLGGWYFLLLSVLLDLNSLRPLQKGSRSP